MLVLPVFSEESAQLLDEDFVLIRMCTEPGEYQDYFFASK